MSTAMIGDPAFSLAQLPLTSPPLHILRRGIDGPF